MAKYLTPRRSTIPHSPSAPTVSLSSIQNDLNDTDDSSINWESDLTHRSNSDAAILKADNAQNRNQSTREELQEETKEITETKEVTEILESSTCESNVEKTIMGAKKEVDSKERMMNFCFIAIGIAILVVSLPLPDFLRGFLLGALICSALSYSLALMTFPLLSSSTKITTPPTTDRIDYQEEAILKYEGFINVGYQYNPCTHRLSLLRSLYVRLDGTTLKVFNPCKAVPKKASAFEQLTGENYLFSRVKVYSLLGASISLVPNRLSRKRKWNRKYPIKVTFPVDGVESSISEENSCASRAGESTNERHSWSSSGDNRLASSFSSQPIDMFLFARSNRDKEDWFCRLSVATAQIHKYHRGFKRVYSTSSPVSIETCVRLSRDSFSRRKVTVEDAACKYDMQYHTFLPAHRIRVQNAQTNANRKPTAIEARSDDINKREGEQPLTGLNVLLGRLYWGMARKERWIALVANKIQAKLATIKVPYFVDKIAVAGIDMGSSLPILLGSKDTKANEQGVWTSLQFTYSGGFALTVETRVDLNKLVDHLQNIEKEKTVDIGSKQQADSKRNRHGTESSAAGRKESGSEREVYDNQRQSMDANGDEGEGEGDWLDAFCDDGVEDSGESSEDESEWVGALMDMHKNPNTEEHRDKETNGKQTNGLLMSPSKHPSTPGSSGASGSGTRSSITSPTPSSHLRTLSSVVGRVAKSDTAKRLRGSQFVNNIIQEISNTHLLLTISVQSINGLILINIPPPPTQSVWWGFDSSSDIVLHVSPKVGTKMIKINMVCNIIGAKLVQEIKKLLFYPNMDDIPVDMLL